LSAAKIGASAWLDKGIKAAGTFVPGRFGKNIERD